MISTGARNAEGARETRRLVTSGLLKAAALALAPIALIWTIFFTLEHPSHAALAGALSGTLLAIVGGLSLRRTVLALAAREESAARQAGHDLLSGLANRKLFAEWVEYELARHRREGVRFALMYLDIDHFKEINDRYGHAAGDRMIVAFSRRISDMLRPTDRLARLGGDEFAILQTGVKTTSDAEALASRIVGGMQTSFRLEDLEISSSVSIGIALCPENAAERENLMNLADLALYRAKKEGRNRFAFFDAGMGEELARRRAFGVELAAAIDADLLSLDYQPVQAENDRSIPSAEARLRWRHAERGILEAGELIELAQARGFLAQLDGWVFRRACRDAAGWNGVRVSVNVSQAQFSSRDFARQVVEMIDETGLDPTRLDLILTEDCILRAKDHALSGMTSLRNEGVRFTLARFGAGVASLDYIRKFPFERIKLDRAFAGSLAGKTADALALRSAIQLGCELGLTFIADGVESEEQIRSLAAIGCQEFQGRAVSTFLSAEEMSRIAATGIERPHRKRQLHASPQA